ncbi:EAL domain-containing protein [Metabacillus idriensis]|uniref:EAL domain-containing protein n=1 Tax=Metabacillus idriensis TaxID=324768 RepID=UPI0021E51BBE|nr:EAL domain-containing protein [Metabacillus idriensis]
MVKALIEVAHRLEMTVIAEGVETEQQKEKLRTMNCDHIQGYVFSKPLPSEEVERLIAPVYT